MTQTKNITVWVVTEKDLTGTQNQCLGIAEALGVDFIAKEITLRQPWHSLSPYLACETKNSFLPPLSSPWPDLVIAGGRKAIAACRYIKKQSPETFCVFVQNPKAAYQNFDLIAAPLHDNVSGPNVVNTAGAPNRITEKKLEKAKTQHPEFDQLSAPKVAVLLGGNSKTHKLTDQIMSKLITQLQNLNAGYMITPSRRTPPEYIEKLKSANLNAYIWNGQGPNPYLSILAKADYILVTGDSVSMLSDAGTTGKPVYIIGMEGGSPKFDRFYKALKEKNIARDFEGTLESWNYAPLNDAQLVANEIKERMDLKE